MTEADRRLQDDTGFQVIFGMPRLNNIRPR
jgi:hypothetical protein